MYVVIVRQELSNYFIWITEMKIASNYPPFGYLVFLELVLPAQKPKTGVLPRESSPPEIFYLRCGFCYLRCSFFLLALLLFYLRCSFFYLRCSFFYLRCSLFICVVAFFYLRCSFFYQAVFPRPKSRLENDFCCPPPRALI